jgi:two-component system nitrate/nitrite sensor histidine kinase NarX
MPSTLTLLVWIFLLISAIAAAAFAVTMRRGQDDLRRRVEHFETNQNSTQRGLSTVLELNRELIEAPDEKALVEAALAAVNRLVGGLGVSFVPFDAWGHPLPAFTFGDLPAPVLSGWAEHLISSPVRERCSQCQTLESPSGRPCPLKVGPSGGTMAIFCFPLALGKHTLGMVNVYLPPEQTVDPEMHQFLEGLLGQMVLAVEGMRLRNQEISTLRQLHRLRSPRGELSATLQALLAGVRSTLAVDGLRLQLHPMVDERLSSLISQSGEMPDPPEDLVERAAFSPQDISSSDQTWISIPLTLPEGQVLGALLAYTSQPAIWGARQVNVLQTAASQAALMIDNERLTLSLEYTLVIQERTRLAREIHDGLAQTLAYLKIQTAQMQTAFNQGDMQRLNRLLGENRQAMAEAYQETRQSIDNLRTAPDENLETWLLKIGGAFEKNTGILVEINLEEGCPPYLPEIQAQMVRIVQEALNNVRKHAHANKVSIVQRAWSGEILLEIRDDGQGFDPEDVPSAAQFGLRGMRERAELIGADFQIISQPRSGTTIRLSLPGQVEEITK